MKKALLITSICLGLIIPSMSMAAPTLSINSVIAEKNATVRSLSTPLQRAWVRSVIDQETSTYQDIDTRWASNKRDALAYKKEILASASDFLTQVKKKSLDFTISESERSTIEKNIIDYQKELTTYIRAKIKEQIGKDTRLFSTLDFTLRGKEGALDLSLQPYNMTVSQDSKSIELDLRLTASGNTTATKYSEAQSGAIMIDANVKILDQKDLYITLRDFSFRLPSQVADDSDTKKFIATMTQMKGRVYHLDLSDEGLDIPTDTSTEEELRMVDALLGILESKSLFTPIAKQGESYALMMNMDTIKSIAQLDKDFQSSTDIPTGEIPALLWYKDGDISTRLFSTNGISTITLSRGITHLPQLTIDYQGRGEKVPTVAKFSMSPTFWALAVSSDGYDVQANATADGATASVKHWSKTLATAQIDTTGVNAWKYDVHVNYEMPSYDDMTEKMTTEDVLIHLWGTLRQEFGSFPILRPANAEDLQKLLDAQK